MRMLSILRTSHTTSVLHAKPSWGAYWRADGADQCGEVLIAARGRTGFLTLGPLYESFIIVHP